MDRDEQLAELFHEWKASARSGAPLSPEQICVASPELLEEFRERLPALQAVDALFDSDAADGEADDSSLDAAGYRSLTFHRQGGLGVVLLGEEAELQRPVAIKRLKPRSALDRTAHQRFIEEAEITARLDHPGVVPIYRAGRDSEGQPYYAMRFVQGETLAEAISRFHSETRAADRDERSLEFRRLVRSLIAVAQTVAYAHSRGVLHRDLKPDNMMLGAFGEALVLDWGLAKRTSSSLRTSEPSPAKVETEIELDAASAPAASSVVGRAKGAPAYMSPEQARGDWTSVGPASDIYGLGATLYVLLTGQTPYSGATAAEIIHKVIHEPPVHPRERHPQTSPALAAICLKAMARSPGERYASAQELAADLERWLADEPVSVLRDPLLVRMQRWMRRHRPIVAGGAAAAAVLIFALAALTIQARRSAERERAAKERLSTAYTRLRQASAVFLSHALGEHSSPQMHEALADVRRHFEDLNDGDAADLFELAAIDNTEGSLYLRSNDAARADPLFARAESHLAQALQLEPQHPDIREALASTWLNRGSTALLQSDPDAAVEWYEKGLRAVAELKAAAQDQSRYRHLEQKLQSAAGRACWTAGNYRWVAGERAEAEQFFERAQSFLAPLAKVEPELPEVRKDYALNLMSWGKLLQNQGIEAFQQSRFEASVREFENALAVWEELSESNPTEFVVMQHLRHVCAGLASACQQRARELADSPEDQNAQLKQVLTTGLAAIERLPAFSPEIQELAPVKADLQQRLNALEEPR